MKRIPLFNLSAQLEPLKNEIFQRFEKAYAATAFTSGTETDEFEAAFAKYCGVTDAIGVRSGTASLLVALKALGIGSGDEVITTPATFSATADAIVLVGATPVFADVAADDGNISPNEIAKKITSKTKAILLVHLYGVPCQMTEIMELANAHHLQVIEDASHAHGTLYKNKKVGSFGTGCFSLYPSKTLGSLGNAGVITTNDHQVAARARMFANHGIKDLAHKYTHHVSGFNELIDNLQSAALNVKMPHIESWITRKLEIATVYNNICHQYEQPSMSWRVDDRPSIYMYSLQIQNREECQAFFSQNGVVTGIYYPTPLHLQPSMKKLGYQKGDLPIAERFFEQTLSLPCYPELSEDDVHFIGTVLAKYFDKTYKAR